MSTVSSIRIMLVDDHEALRQSIKLALLVYDDFELVGQAANGAEAVELCAQVWPQVILMDLSMPGMDGITATRLIRRRCPQVKIIILASFEDAPLVETALRAGANSYLYKDFTIDLLADLIRAANGHSDQYRQNQSGRYNRGEISYDRVSGNDNEAGRG